MKLKTALILTTALAGANAMACYTVYDRNDNVVYQGETAPVDMSRPLHETLGRSYPGMQMVFDQGTDCRAVIPSRAVSTRAAAVVQSAPDTRSMGAGPATASRGAGPSTKVMGAAAAPSAVRAKAAGAPLLTDRRTARSLNLPYQEMSGEIVMVPPEAAARVRPGVNVVPRGAIGEATSEAPASRGRGDLVITEMRNPPLTIVEANGVVISAR